MKKLPFALVLAIALSLSESHGREKGTLKWMSFNEGVVEARRTGKKVMIEVHGLVRMVQENG